MNLNHIHIGTRDLTKSVDFYTQMFGFRKKFDHEPGIFLENDAGFLLAIDPVDNVPSLPEWFHVGFCLESAAAVQKSYERAKDHRAKIVRDLLVKDGQFASFFMVDPDGYRIEVSWHNE